MKEGVGQAWQSDGVPLHAGMEAWGSQRRNRLRPHRLGLWERNERRRLGGRQPPVRQRKIIAMSKTSLCLGTSPEAAPVAHVQVLRGEREARLFLWRRSGREEGRGCLECRVAVSPNVENVGHAVIGVKVHTPDTVVPGNEGVAPHEIQIPEEIRVSKVCRHAAWHLLPLSLEGPVRPAQRLETPTIEGGRLRFVVEEGINGGPPPRLRHHQGARHARHVAAFFQAFLKANDWRHKITQEAYFRRQSNKISPILTG
ncbi:hypothetical protein E2C01_020022 [Portunus trituberculatus]|uniref:Uncharacterized protein n=1 Tax=Portunus trituberculatus TaxID=210409 RepID=A0A5B7DZ37_PORTR|nr:hypothetical protein [Portunus trituberculatus]